MLSGSAHAVVYPFSNLADSIGCRLGTQQLHFGASEKAAR